MLSEKGAPTPVAWTRMRAPESLMAPSPDATIDAAVAASPLLADYGTAVERDSAFEMLDRAASERVKADEAAAAAAEKAKVDAAAAADAEKARVAAEKAAEKERLAAEKARATQDRREASEPGVVESVVKSSAFKSILRSAGTVIGREITRSIFGTARRR